MTLTAVAQTTRLRFHLLLLLVVLIGTIPLLHVAGSYSSDDGAYAVQVHRLERGHWDVAWPGAAVDPSQRWFPFVNSSQAGDRRFAYVQHPAWPLAMTAAVRAFGESVGLRLLPLLGTLGVAAAAWLLAAEIDSRRRVLAFWLAAAGPPLAGATMLWAHTVSAALAGLAMVAAIRVLRGRRGYALLAPLVAAGVLVRAEGLLWAAALGLGCGCWALWRRHVRTAAKVAATVWGSGLVAVAVERMMIRRVAGGAYADPGLRHEAGSYLAGRVAGFLREVVAGGSGERGAVVFGAVALVLAVIGGIRLARPDGHRAGVRLLMAAAGAFALRTILGGGDPATGVLGCWPIAAAGLAALVAAPRRRHNLDVAIAAVSLLFGAAVVVTQYDGGGGVEWGGRFFSPVLVPLAVLAAGGLVAAGCRRLVAAVALLAAVPALSGLRSVALLRRPSESIVTRLRAADAPVAVTSMPALPRMAWASDPDVTWFLAPEAEIDDVLAQLRRACVPRVALVVEDPRPPAAEGYTVVSGDARAHGYRLLVADNGAISGLPNGTAADRLGACPTGL